MTPAPQQGGADAPRPILLAAAGPAAQRRVTVAVRLILAIPHLIVLYLLTIAAFAVAVIGWFGALAAGRLPDFAFTFLSGYLRWFSRVEGYLLLLTDEYPPFVLEDEPYPLRLAVGAGKLNRLTVAFRVILAIPAAIVATLLTSGFATIMVFIAWLTALVAGRLPVSLHQAFTAVLRYTIRYYGYLYLLTDVYPAGLFGDAAAGQPPGAVAPPGGPGYGTAGPGQAGPYPGYGTPPPAGYGTPPPTGYGQPPAGYQDYRPPGYGAPGYQAPGYQAPGPEGAQTRYDVPVSGQDTLGYGTPGYGTPWPPFRPVPEAAVPWGAASAPGTAASWELVLSSGARRLVGLVLVLGLLTAAGEGAWAGASISAAITRDREISQLNTDTAKYDAAVERFNAVVVKHNASVTAEQQAVAQVTAASSALSNAQSALDDALGSPGADASHCASVACFNTTALPVVNALAAFGRTLNATPVPSGSAAAKQRLLTDTANDQQDWTKITQATSFSSIVTIATNAETVGEQFDNDTSALMTSLNNASTALSAQASTLSNAATGLNATAAHLYNEGTVLNRRAAALNVKVKVLTPVKAL
jgi:hypothetical protein